MTHDAFPRQNLTQGFHLAVKMRLYPDYFRVFNRCPKDSFSVDSWSFIENARGSFLSLSYDFFNCLGADSRLHKANILIFLLHFFPYDERTKKARIPVNYISCNYRRNDCRRFYFYPIFCPNTWIISAVVSLGNNALNTVRFCKLKQFNAFF